MDVSSAGASQHKAGMPSLVLGIILDDRSVQESFFKLGDIQSVITALIIAMQGDYVLTLAHPLLNPFYC
jgi:hypothetical protein